MKKILLFIRKESLQPIGGPQGYLYNLQSGFSKVKSDKYVVDFLKSQKNEYVKRTRSLYDRLPLWIKTIYRLYGHWKDYKLIEKPIVLADDINQYDIIHFHDCFQLYRARNILENFKGKVLLTSHCPKPPQLEKVEDIYSPIEQILFAKCHLKKYTEYVKFAFNRADYIIFPCEGAEESYIRNWDEYSELRKNKKEKLRYLPTGLKDCSEKAAIAKEDIRRKYGIPQDALVISFIGRHNKVKGYDRLRKIGKLLEKHNDIYIIVAGEEYPLKKPNLERWIEVGWTKDPYSIINASDIFILPNQETYFDLVLIEVLSLGKAAIISRTGGNKYFNNLSQGIVLFDNENDCTAIVEQLAQNRDKIKRMGIENRNLYDSQFTDVEFAKNYFKIIDEL